MQWGGSVLGVGGQDGNGWTGGSLALDAPVTLTLGTTLSPSPSLLLAPRLRPSCGLAGTQWCTAPSRGAAVLASGEWRQPPLWSSLIAGR